MAFEPQIYNCGTYKCKTTNHRGFLPKASAIIFREVYLKQGDKESLPKFRSPDQLWILHRRESPGAAEGRFKVPRWQNNLFNLTMSYHRSADIYRPYGITLSRDNKANPEYLDQSVVNFVYNSKPSQFHQGCEKDSVQDNTTKGIAVNSPDAKDTTVLWITSHCDSKLRDSYVARLKNHLKVDKFGMCNKRPFCARLPSII